jgi:hypothetical protein
MLASEMNTFLQSQKTILLSSINTFKELPFYYRWPAKLKLHRLLPSKPGNHANLLVSWLFGINNKADKTMLGDVLANTDTHFSRWAINAVVNWERQTTETNIIRIHGSNDRILPITNFKPHYIINQGGHLVVMNRAAEVSVILQQEIAQL